MLAAGEPVGIHDVVGFAFNVDAFRVVLSIYFVVGPGAKPAVADLGGLPQYPMDSLKHSKKSEKRQLHEELHKQFAADPKSPKNDDEWGHLVKIVFAKVHDKCALRGIRASAGLV